MLLLINHSWAITKTASFKTVHGNVATTTETVPNGIITTTSSITAAITTTKWIAAYL